MKIKLLFVFLFAATLSKAQNINVQHYKFTLELNDQNDSLTGRADITFLIKGNNGSCAFDLAGLSNEGRGMRVTQVSYSHPVQASADFKQEDDRLVLSGVPAKNGDLITVSIWYRGIPRDGLIVSKNKFGERTFFGDNWPNRAHHWLPCVDRPDDKASFEFLVTAPSPYTVISNGVKVEEKELGNGKRLTHWQEDFALPTKVMVIGAARFAVKTYTDSAGGVPVSAWVYPQDSTKGFYDYGLAPGILQFLANYIGPFPYRKLANVQSSTIFGGMENASAIFYAENTVTGDRSSEDLMAHEIAHQWFGDAASEKSFAHLWLSEGFATYLTNLYFEKKYGGEAMIKRLKEEREEAANFALSSNRPVIDSTGNLMSLLNANSYQKGAWVLHMLRREVGDSVFQKIIQTYYKQYKGSNAESNDFEVIAEKISGKELTPFFDQWLHRPGIPVIAVKTESEKEVLRVTVEQKQAKPFHFPLEILVEGNNGKKMLIRETITAGKQSFRYTPGFVVKKLTLDPHCNLLYQKAGK